MNNRCTQSNSPRYVLRSIRPEDVNDIAFQTLEQRMGRELSRSVLRAATKKALELAVTEENEVAGMFVSAINAGTEKADTRNWQSLPHGIFYARVPLQEGTNEIELNVIGQSGNRAGKQTFTFEGVPGQTIIHAYQTLN